jgi:hypothetical protein
VVRHAEGTGASHHGQPLAEGKEEVTSDAPRSGGRIDAQLQISRLGTKDLSDFGDLGQYHPFRRFCIRVSMHPDFEFLVMLAILTNSVTLSLYRPLEPEDSAHNMKLFWAGSCNLLLASLYKHDLLCVGTMTQAHYDAVLCHFMSRPQTWC